MKKLLVMITILVAVIAICIKLNKGNIPNPDNKVEEKSNLEATEYQNTFIEIRGFDYVANIVRIKFPGEIVLYSNLEEKLTADEISKDKKCKYLVNAGFHDEQNNHIGLFIAEYNIISYTKTSSTFNAYFSTNDGKAYITQIPINNPRISVQSGPGLIKNELIQKLTIKNDESARRVVAATNKSGDVLFIVIYSKDSLYQGPFLEQLPEVLMTLSNQINLKITDALNLDGGTHSAFYSDEVKLKELSLIGGYFCIK